MTMTPYSRRRFLGGAIASLTTTLPLDARAESVCRDRRDCTTKLCLPPPNFAIPNNPVMLARYRPHRENTYRLKTEPVAGKWIVHNYGHGGGGITMSLGCAEQVVSLVQAVLDEHGPGAAKDGIAVIGGGVMGLAAATALARRYWPATPIDLYTKEFYRETTSHVAGGQWAPSSVEWRKHDVEANALFKTILASSLKQFTAMIGTAYGVSRKTNYTLFDKDSSGLEIAHDFGLIDKTPLERLPFARMNCSGFAYKTLLVEPPIFLKKLHNDLVAKLGLPHIHKRAFADPKAGQDVSPDIVALKQKIIVNCTGYAAGALFKDDDIKPIKGQLVLLPPQPQLDYLFSGYSCGDWAQYLFPRRDAVIVGGTYQEEPHHQRANPAVGRQIAASFSRLFDGAQPACPHESANDLDKDAVV